eukprot:jgi/Ulvmu1/9700/UM055_0038.1
MSGAPAAAKANNNMPGAHSSTVNQMKPTAGAFDHTAAVERSPFLQRVQKVMSSGTDISIRSPEAASEFVELVKESTPRARGPLIHILQASIKKQDKQVLQALVDHGLLVELCKWLQSLQETAMDSTDDKANVIALCKAVSALPVTANDMRSSKIGHILTSLSKVDVDDVAAAATSTRDLLRDRVKSLKVPGGLSKRSIATASAPATNGSQASVPGPQVDETISSSVTAAGATPEGQTQAPHTASKKPNSAFVAAGALQERTDPASAPLTLPVSFGGPPASTVEVPSTDATSDPAAAAAGQAGNGALSRLQATISAPARKAGEVFGAIKRSITSATSGAGGKADSEGVMSRMRQTGTPGSRGRLGSLASGRTPLLTSATVPPVLEIPDTASAAEKAKLVGDAAERAHGVHAETPANKRKRLREAGKPIKKVQFREGLDLERVQLFFSDEVPGFVPMHKRDGGPGGDADGPSGGFGGAGFRQDTEDKHVRFQESSRLEHLAERVMNLGEQEFVGVDRKALARLHSPPDIKFAPVEVPLPEVYGRGEDSTEAASRAAYCEAHPVPEPATDMTPGGDKLSKQRVVPEDPPRPALAHWDHPTMFGFQTAVSAANVETLRKEQDEAITLGAVKRVAPAHTYKAHLLAQRATTAAPAAAAAQPERAVPPAQPDAPMQADIHWPLPAGSTPVLVETKLSHSGLSAPPPDVQGAFSTVPDAATAVVASAALVPLNGMPVQLHGPTGTAAGSMHGAVPLAGSQAGAPHAVASIPISTGPALVWLQSTMAHPPQQASNGRADECAAVASLPQGLGTASDVPSGFHAAPGTMYHGVSRVGAAGAMNGDVTKRPRMGEGRLAGTHERSGPGHSTHEPAAEHDFSSRKRFKEDAGNDLRHGGASDSRRWDRDGTHDGDGGDDHEDMRWAARGRHERPRERSARHGGGGGADFRDRDDDIADKSDRRGLGAREWLEREWWAEDDERGWDRGDHGDRGDRGDRGDHGDRGDRGDRGDGDRRERGARGHAKGRGGRGGGRGGRGGRVCSFWSSPSGCFQGDDCKFLHEGEGHSQPKPDWFKEKHASRGRGRGRGGRDRSDSP